MKNVNLKGSWKSRRFGNEMCWLENMKEVLSGTIQVESWSGVRDP